MTRTNYSRGREIEYLARDRLQSQGHQVIRSAGSRSPVDLIAWRRFGRLVFIQVKRTRTPLDHPAQVIRRFHDDIEALRAMDRPYFVSMQLWLWTDLQGWRFFDIMQGGICEVASNVA